MICYGRLKIDIDLPLWEKVKNGIVDHRGDYGYPRHKNTRRKNERQNHRTW